MKNLRIKQSCLVNGEHAEAGTIIKNVDNAVAADLVVSGRAEEVNGKPEIENRDTPPTDRDPKPAKKAGK